MSGLPVTWIAERFVNGVPEGIAIALVAWILLRAAGRKNSSTRFAVWLMSLAAIVAVPLLTGFSTREAESASSLVKVPGAWAVGLLLVWIGIATAALGRIAVGLWNLRKLRRGCTTIDTEAVQRVLDEFGESRKVQVAVSPEVRVPAAIGFFRPMILLPEWALTDLSADELNSILIHELAHLRRWDDWTNLAQRIVRALLFFHPAVWWVDKELSLEREMACDDVVLSNTANPRAYAECLVSVAEKSVMRRGLALAQAAVSRVRETSRRVAQILDVNRAPATRVWKPAVGLVAAVSMAGAFSLAHAPELVAFRDAAPVMEAASSSNPAIMPAHYVQNDLTPKVVPAKFVEHENAVRSKPAVKRHVSHSPALLQARSERPTLGVQPRSTALEIRELPIQTVYLVMSSDGYGQPSMMICVWQVRFVEMQAAGAKIPAKKI